MNKFLQSTLKIIEIMSLLIYGLFFFVTHLSNPCLIKGSMSAIEDCHKPVWEFFANNQLLFFILVIITWVTISTFLVFVQEKYLFKSKRLKS